MSRCGSSDLARGKEHAVIRDRFVVFHDQLALLDTDYYSGPHLMSRLAAHDQLSLFAVGSFGTAWTGTLTIALEHSSDGINFEDKTLSGDTTPLLGEGSPAAQAYDPGDEA